MKNQTVCLLWIFLLFSSSIRAQSDVSIRRSEFRNDKSGLKEAWQHVEEGDSYYSKKGRWYANAYDEYLKAYAYNNSNPELNYKTGVSALLSDSKEEAAGFLLKALENENKVAGDILLVTGRALQFSGKYPEAIVRLEAYLSENGKKSKEDIALARKWLGECKNALLLTDDTLRVEIKNLGSEINSNSDDYSLVLADDGRRMFFASRRETKKSSNYYKDSKFDENIFFSAIDSGRWEAARSAGKNLTTKYCETPVAVDSANKLYIYAGYENGGDIMVSATNRKGEWKVPERVPFRINTKGMESSMSFSPSGDQIYFVAENNKKGIGGRDIYYLNKLKEKKWSKPLNAGKVINTEYDEESVRFSSGGDTLWFSSQGHNSIGGYDIFFSVKNSAGEWDSVRNCGFPVNTPWDELFFEPSPSDDSSFFFVSNRSGGLGGLDIYEGTILPPPPLIAVPVPVILPEPKAEPEPVLMRDTVIIVSETTVAAPVELIKPDEVILYLTGTVKDSETGDPIIARVDVIDPGTDITVATTASSDIDGSFRVRLPSKRSYMIDFRGNGYLPELKKFSIPANDTREIFNLNIALAKVKVGKKVVLNNILFESGKSILTAGSYKEIDRLIETLNENKQMKIEISGHTDKTGNEQLNFVLSEERARAVVEYLTRNGIDRSRLTYKGYGPAQPVDVNTTAAGRAKNRRVEFKILEF